MSQHLEFVFYYPHPENHVDCLVTITKSGRIGSLWNEARNSVSILERDVGKQPKLFIVCLSFLYSTVVFLISTLATRLET